MIIRRTGHGNWHPWDILPWLLICMEMVKLLPIPRRHRHLAGTFYQNPQLGKTRLDAAINKIKEYEQTDPANIAAIGYCFGGSVVLNSAKLGSDLKGVVSFHGGLAGVKPDKNLLKAKILVCHGGSDKFVPQHDVDVFKHQLDSVGQITRLKYIPMQRMPLQIRMPLKLVKNSICPLNIMLRRIKIHGMI